MSSNDEKLNSLNNDIEFWKDYSSYKKAFYLTQNAPDCSFVLTLDANTSKTFNAHKSILISASPKFEAMFNTDGNMSKDILLSDTDPQIFKKFLDFIYFGDDENLRCADANTLRNLISLGKKFKVDDLIKTCVDTMKHNLINAENYDLINIFEYACLMEDNELIKECKRVIVGRAKPKPKFQDFNFNQHHDDKRSFTHVKKHINKSIEKSAGAAGDGPLDPFAALINKNASGSRNQFSSPQHKAQTTASGGFNIAPVNNIFDVNATTAVQPQLSNSQTPQFSFSFSSTPVSQTPAEEKLQNIESNNNENAAASGTFNELVYPTGLNKGKITDCACIYALNPSVFYEFQITLSGYISEILRFNIIETYAKINCLTGNNSDLSDLNNQKLETLVNDESNEPLKKEENRLLPEPKKQSTIGLSKQILNMMLRSIKFHRMTAKEFCSGPGKSSLLELEEKFDLLVTIVNKN